MDYFLERIVLVTEEKNRWAMYIITVIFEVFLWLILY